MLALSRDRFRRLRRSYSAPYSGVTENVTSGGVFPDFPVASRCVIMYFQCSGFGAIIYISIQEKSSINPIARIHHGGTTRAQPSYILPNLVWIPKPGIIISIREIASAAPANHSLRRTYIPKPIPHQHRITNSISVSVIRCPLPASVNTRRVRGTVPIYPKGQNHAL